MFNPYERIPIDVDPRNIPDDLRHYHGPGNPADYIPADQLGVRSPHQLPQRDIQGIGQGAMEEAALLQRRIAEQQVPPPTLPSVIHEDTLPPPPHTFRSGESHHRSTEPMRLPNNMITAEQWHAERRHKKRMQQMGGAAAAAIAVIWAGSAVLGPDHDGHQESALPAAPYSANFGCRVDGVAERSDTAASVEVYRTHDSNRYIGSRAVTIVGRSVDGELPIMIQARPSEASNTTFEFLSDGFHNRTISVVVENGDKGEACATTVTLGNPGPGDEHVLG